MKKPVKYILLGLYMLSFVIVAASLIWTYAGDPPPLCTTLAKVFFVLWLICFFLLQFYIECKKTDVRCKEESELGEQNTKCKFCDPASEFSHYLIPERNQMDTDNLCEILTQRLGDEVNGGNDIWCNECYGCTEENTHFVLNAFDNCISLSYRFKGRDLQIDRNSEVMHINFCPWCGRRLSEKMVVFEKCVPCSIDAPVPLKE